MSGHNKWSTIKHKKGAADAKRGKIFTKLIKELTVAARMGGGDPTGNPRLRSAIALAKGANMPSDNVIRAIKKGTGELEGVSYEESVFEGYGPNGVAVMVETMSDNRKRTVAELRHIFTKFGGNLGENGCVGYMFQSKGLITVARAKEDGTEIAEDEVMMAALDAGAEDVEAGDESFDVYTALADLYTVRQTLENAGYPIQEANPARVPTTTVKLEGKQADSVMKFLDAIEDSEDVQKVWANADIDDDTAANFG